MVLLERKMSWRGKYPPGDENILLERKRSPGEEKVPWRGKGPLERKRSSWRGKGPHGEEKVPEKPMSSLRGKVLIERKRVVLERNRS